MIYVYGKVMVSVISASFFNFPVKNHTTHNPEQSEKLQENNITLELSSAVFTQVSLLSQTTFYSKP